MTDRELKYYNLFSHNLSRGQHYHIKLNGGKILAGVPKVYRLVHQKDPTFFINGSEFLLRDVVDAEEISEITIYAAKQLDGYTCRLEPKSKMAIKSQLPPNQPLVASVFISYEDKSDFEMLHGSIWKHIAELLTGLSMEKLQELGQVVFVDAKTMEIVFDFSEQHV